MSKRLFNDRWLIMIRVTLSILGTDMICVNLGAVHVYPALPD